MDNLQSFYTMRDAILDGEVEEVERLLGEGFDPNYRPSKSDIPLLLLAIANRQTDIVKLLLSPPQNRARRLKGADPKIRHRMETPFYVASNNNYLDIVELLLDTGAFAIKPLSIDYYTPEVVELFNVYLPSLGILSKQAINKYNIDISALPSVFH